MRSLKCDDYCVLYDNITGRVKVNFKKGVLEQHSNNNGEFDDVYDPADADPCDGPSPPTPVVCPPQKGTLISGTGTGSKDSVTITYRGTEVDYAKCIDKLVFLSTNPRGLPPVINSKISLSVDHKIVTNGNFTLGATYSGIARTSKGDVISRVRNITIEQSGCPPAKGTPLITANGTGSKTSVTITYTGTEADYAKCIEQLVFLSTNPPGLPPVKNSNIKLTGNSIVTKGNFTLGALYSGIAKSSAGDVISRATGIKIS